MSNAGPPIMGLADELSTGMRTDATVLVAHAAATFYDSSGRATPSASSAANVHRVMLDVPVADRCRGACALGQYETIAAYGKLVAYGGGE